MDADVNGATGQVAGRTMTYPTTELYVDGQLRKAADGRCYDNLGPASGTIVGQAADAGRHDVDAAIAAARRAFDAYEWSRDRELRARVLRRWRDELAALADDWRHAIAAETGAPLGLTYGYQLDLPLSFMDWTLDLANRYEYETDIGVTHAMQMPTRRLVVKEPAGVVAAITPWNAPVQINLAKTVAALAAGCTVVLKAAPETPWSAALLGVAAARAGLPPGVLNVITSADKVGAGAQLVTDPRVDVVSFTGSTATGRRIMAAAAEGVKRVFLELGGKSANVVLDDAAFPEALYGGLAVCYHAGQGCSITTRILLPRSRYAEAIEVLRALLESLPYGDPLSREQILGPLISAEHRERVLGYIRLGVAEGARLVTGGRVPERLPQGYYLEPTLFADVDNRMRIAQEEIFGPVLVAIPHDGDDDAVRIANESSYGLGGAVQSASVERAVRVARRLRTGTVNINTGNAFDADAPFGGYKQSGVGREMGAEGFAEYLETKTIGVPA
jgi:aldehyde dehydrogenase (NAD+)